MPREKYADYVRLFNARDERFIKYYDDIIVFDHGGTGGVLREPAEILSF